MEFFVELPNVQGIRITEARDAIRRAQSFEEFQRARKRPSQPCVIVREKLFRRHTQAQFTNGLRREILRRAAAAVKVVRTLRLRQKRKNSFSPIRPSESLCSDSGPPKSSTTPARSTTSARIVIHSYLATPCASCHRAHRVIVFVFKAISCPS